MANTKITTNVIADDAVTSDKLGGDLTMPGHVSLADSKEIRVGTGNDLVIKHDGSHTTLTNTTGNLILAGGTVYIANAANNEYMAQFVADGAASLKFNNVEELATVSGGVYIPNELGIGTNSPNASLDVVSNSSANGIELRGRNADNIGQLTFESNDSGTTYSQLQSLSTELKIKTIANINMSFHTNNTERLRIDSVGRVLIGTENSRLTSGVTPNFVIEGTSYNTNSIGVFTNANGVLDCPAMFFGKSRGTSDGSNTIVQNGDRLFSMRIDGSDGTNLEQAAIMEAHVDGSPAANSIPGRITFMTTTAGSQYAVERMRIDSTGIVTIRPDTGATTGTLRLHNGNGSGTLSRIDFGHSGNVDHGSIIYDANMDFKAGDSSTSNFYINSAGNVGINTSNPEHHLHVTEPGSTREDGIVKIGGSTTALGLELRYNQSGSTTTQIVANPTYTNTASIMKLCVDGDLNANQLCLLGHGGVAIGTDDPGSNRFYVYKDTNGDFAQYVLQDNAGGYGMGIRGDGGSMIYFYIGGTYQGHIYSSGGSTTYGTGSDYRLKDNVVEMKGAIDKLKKLRPVTFNFKESPDVPQQGFIAHEAQEVVPHAVAGEKDAEINEEHQIGYQSMEYGKVTPLLTAALQEALAKIETLETKVAALESK